MIIAVDAREAFRRRRRGVGKTIVNLYNHLALLRPDWEFVMLHRGVDTENPFYQRSNVRSVVIDFPGDRLQLWDRLWLPMALRWTRADVLHSPSNSGPRRSRIPVIITIHDLIPLDWGDAGTVLRYTNELGAASKLASRIVTPSEFTKQEVVRRLHSPPQKVVVIPWASQPNIENGVGDLSTLHKYRLDGNLNYIMAFGSINPRKNIRRLLEAWAGLSHSIKRDHILLLVGVEPEALGSFHALSRELLIDTQLLICGFLAEKDVSTLLSRAKALCYVSLSEGFGLPVLDAFACRTPVLASNVTSVPEVAGDAALFVDPLDVGSIKSGLQRILSDAVLREQLVQRGTNRLNCFSWTRSAESMAAVIEEV